jgi:hypothetical protein
MKGKTYFSWFRSIAKAYTEKKISRERFKAEWRHAQQTLGIATTIRRPV